MAFQFILYQAPLMAQTVKHLPAMLETWVRFLDQEDPLEKEMASTAAVLPGKRHRRRSLAGYSPWGHKESTRLSDFTFQAPLPHILLFQFKLKIKPLFLILF